MHGHNARTQLMYSTVADTDAAKPALYRTGFCSDYDTYMA